MRVLNGLQMKEADRRTIGKLKIPSLVLMENAGRQVVAAMESAFENLSTRSVAVLCGSGSNGGDGFVVARALSEKEVRVSVFLLCSKSDVRDDALIHLESLANAGISVTEIFNKEEWELSGSEVTKHDVIVDALLGTGLSRPLEGLLKRVVADINAACVPVVAVDIPSGLSSETHRLIGDTIQATLTVTFGAPKLPHVLAPGVGRTGDLVVADIGIPTSIIDELGGPRLNLVTPEDICRLIPVRDQEAHKGNFGRVLVVAGSLGKTGAACLAGLGALRSGAGLVTVATPGSCLSMVSAGAAEYMTLPLTESASGTVDERALEQILDAKCDVIAVGPGLGTDSGPANVVKGLIARAEVPVIVDADALTVLGNQQVAFRGRGQAKLVITPHPGEMARLCGVSAEDVQRDRVEVARRFAVEHEVYVVLKGARTVVAAPEGTVFLNISGNSGMATGGTGDVLTGVMAAWLAQIKDVKGACQVAVYLHGAAGDLAAERQGEVALIASDVVESLGQALRGTMDEATSE